MIGQRLGPFDLAAVPIGAYLPREMMGRIHVTPEEGVAAALDAGARIIGVEPELAGYRDLIAAVGAVQIVVSGTNAAQANQNGSV